MAPSRGLRLVAVISLKIPDILRIAVDHVNRYNYFGEDGVLKIYSLPSHIHEKGAEFFREIFSDGMRALQRKVPRLERFWKKSSNTPVSIFQDYRSLEDRGFDGEYVPDFGIFQPLGTLLLPVEVAFTQPYEDCQRKMRRYMEMPEVVGGIIVKLVEDPPYRSPPDSSRTRGQGITTHQWSAMFSNHPLGPHAHDGHVWCGRVHCSIEVWNKRDDGETDIMVSRNVHLPPDSYAQTACKGPHAIPDNITPDHPQAIAVDEAIRTVWMKAVLSALRQEGAPLFTGHIPELESCAGLIDSLSRGVECASYRRYEIWVSPKRKRSVTPEDLPVDADDLSGSELDSDDDYPPPKQLRTDPPSQPRGEGSNARSLRPRR